MNFAATYRKRKVFLTGHTGFKGAWLSEWLLQLGAEVAGYSNGIPTQPALFEALGLSGRLGDIRGDVRDLAALRAALKESQASVVFHLAAQSLVRASYDDPLETFSTNIMGTANLLEAVRACPSVEAVVVITTDKVYENNGAKNNSFREFDPLGGHDPYSASKAGAEIIFSSYSRSFFQGGGVKVAAARAGNVIGGGDWAVDRLVPDCMRAWASKKKVLIRNPASVRPWQHVLEPLGGYLLLGQRLLEQPQGVAGEAFNFGPLSGLTRPAVDIVMELQKNWADAGVEIKADSGSAKKEAAFLSLNIEKAERVLSWRPRLNFSETAAWVADWYRESSRGKEALELTRQQIARFESHAVLP